MRGRQPFRAGGPTYDFAKFSEKIAWNFGPWGEGGVVRAGGAPLKSATAHNRDIATEK